MRKGWNPKERKEKLIPLVDLRKGLERQYFIFSRTSSPEFENNLGKRYNSSFSEFKVHFFIRKVHMNGMNEDEFLAFIKRKGILVKKKKI